MREIFLSRCLLHLFTQMWEISILHLTKLIYRRSNYEFPNHCLVSKIKHKYVIIVFAVKLYKYNDCLIKK